MKLQLDKYFRIEGDFNSFILSYEFDTGEVNPKTGKNIIRTDEWYYSSIKDCLNSYIDRCIGGDFSAIKDVIARYNALLVEIDRYNDFVMTEKDLKMRKLELEIKELKSRINE